MTQAMKQEFEGVVVSRDGDGRIVINLSDLPAEAGRTVETTHE